jgi:anaphase-promoting complex subunit 5
VLPFSFARYSALNLAALHSHFKHTDLAISALKEVIMLAQDANDHVCLQHALAWLLRIDKSITEEEEKEMLAKYNVKCEELQLTYLRGLGFQTLAQSMALRGEIDIFLLGVH